MLNLPQELERMAASGISATKPLVALWFSLYTKVDRAKRGALQEAMVASFRAHWADRGIGPDQLFVEAMREAIAGDSLRHARVYCMTESLANDYMWDAYADHGSGIAIEFSPLESPESPLKMARKVAYSDEPLVCGNALDFIMHGPSLDVQREILSLSITTKETRYAPEREWRLVTWRPEEPDQMHMADHFSPREVRSVTVGWGARSEDVAELRTAMRRYPWASLVTLSSPHDVRRLG